MLQPSVNKIPNREPDRYFEGLPVWFVSAKPYTGTDIVMLKKLPNDGNEIVYAVRSFDFASLTEEMLEQRLKDGAYAIGQAEEASYNKGDKLSN